MMDPTSMIIRIGMDQRIRWWGVVDEPAERAQILRRTRRTVVTDKLYAQFVSEALAGTAADSR